MISSDSCSNCLSTFRTEAVILRHHLTPSVMPLDACLDSQDDKKKNGTSLNMITAMYSFRQLF